MIGKLSTVVIDCPDPLALARDWAPTLLPGHPVDVLPVVTLRPLHGLPMTLHRRA